MEIESIVGMKHSSLNRELEWQRLALRDKVRPDFKIYTGNDLAIDMVMYGSDYLLGLSSFSPEAFALRDRFWADGDARFYQLNDLLQYLGFFAFRPPTPNTRYQGSNSSLPATRAPGSRSGMPSAVSTSWLLILSSMPSDSPRPATPGAAR